ncbi:hypothetical protein [Kribbella shirazensis]|uniref:Uncharacterized protein n=1 Tax=Kribbella shirazensis TaxID=1105143 RepID=A0A7X5V6P5_9ACTN|nr:hypothetical protein [Kribbella shirazensis]NIK55364.1 hypothetical protein [Kribbella shirazensis]
MTFASTSLPRHLLRGVIGFGSVVAAVALIPAVGLLSLLLLPVALIAFRGCPTCWVVGLLETISRGKLQRDCTDGSCKLTTAG